MHCLWSSVIFPYYRLVRQQQEPSRTTNLEFSVGLESGNDVELEREDRECQAQTSHVIENFTTGLPISGALPARMVPP
eukprot:751198-Hanusia_phi.AAC.4